MNARRFSADLPQWLIIHGRFEENVFESSLAFTVLLAPMDPLPQPGGRVVGADGRLPAHAARRDVAIPGTGVGSGARMLLCPLIFPKGSAMSLIDQAKQAAQAALDKTKEVADSAAQAVEEAAGKAGHVLEEAGSAFAQGVTSAAEQGRALAGEAAEATASASAAVMHGAQGAFNSAAAAGAGAVAGASQIAGKAVDAAISRAEKLTGKDLNKDGKIG